MHRRIKELRKEKLGLTQGDFARPIGMSQQNLANIEHGKVNITERVFNDICEAYNVNPVWLETGEGEVFRPGKSETARRILSVMADLPDEYWEVLGDIIDRYNKKK